MILYIYIYIYFFPPFLCTPVHFSHLLTPDSDKYGISNKRPHLQYSLLVLQHPGRFQGFATSLALSAAGIAPSSSDPFDSTNIFWLSRRMVEGNQSFWTRWEPSLLSPPLQIWTRTSAPESIICDLCPGFSKSVAVFFFPWQHSPTLSSQQATRLGLPV